MKLERNHIKGPMSRLRGEFVVMENMTLDLISKNLWRNYFTI